MRLEVRRPETTWLKEDVTLPECCRNKHSSCCGWLPAQRRRSRRSLQPPETPINGCWGPWGRCHCGIWKSCWEVEGAFGDAGAWTSRLGAHPWFSEGTAIGPCLDRVAQLHDISVPNAPWYTQVKSWRKCSSWHRRAFEFAIFGITTDKRVFRVHYN